MSDIITNAELKSQVEAEKRAKNSLLAFRERFIPSKDDVPPAPFHEEWSDILLNGTGHFAVEAFRESAKTQIVIRANLLHALTYPRASRSYLVVICATQRTASKKLTEVSREFLTSDDMCKLVANVRENSGLALEVEYHGLPTVRIEAYGKGAAVRGLSWGAKRPDLVIIDDPQDQEDARSETVTEADWDWFLSDVYFLGQSTRIFLIGNNLGERCIIEGVMRGAQRLKFTAKRIPILTQDGKSSWPDKWPLYEIDRDRTTYSLEGKIDIWYREKMCQAISPDSQKFKKSYFRYYEIPPKLNEMNVYTQIMHRGIHVTQTQEVVLKYGLTQETAYQMRKTLKELAFDCEQALLTQDTKVYGSMEEPRQFGGLPYWIATNRFENGGTARDLTFDLINMALEQTWVKGGKPSVLLMSPRNKRIISTFTAGNVKYMEGNKTRRLTQMISVLETDFGTLQCLTDRFMEDDKIYGLSPEYMKKAFLRPFKTGDMPEMSDMYRKYVKGEWTLEMRAEKAHFMIGDLNGIVPATA